MIQQSRPRALDKAEIAGIVQDFAKAVKKRD